MYEYLDQYPSKELNLLRIHIDNDRFLVYNNVGKPDYVNTQYVYDCIMNILFERQYIDFLGHYL